MQEDVAEAELVLVGVMPVAEVFQLQVVADWKIDLVVGESVLEERLEV